jgi:hypothetical protein
VAGGGAAGPRGAATLALALIGCGEAPVAPPVGGPAPVPAAAAIVGLVAGEHTWCALTADGRARCAGALTVDGVAPAGERAVDDGALCGRGEGVVGCASARGSTTAESPFVEWRRGPGFPCGRTRDGSVFCATSDVPEGADVGLVPLPGPPARALGSDGQRWLVLGDDGVVWAHPPPAHGGGRAARVAERVVALASDGWTLACWARADGTTCTDGPRPPAERLAVGTGVACGTGAGGDLVRGRGGPGRGGACGRPRRRHRLRVRAARGRRQLLGRGSAARRRVAVSHARARPVAPHEFLTAPGVRLE